MKKLTLLLCVVMLSGCVTTNTIDPNYALYVEAQKNISIHKKDQPLVRIKAQPGSTIKMEGVEEFIVYAPKDGSEGQAITQYVTPRNDAAEVAKAALGVVGTVGSIFAVGNATKGLATAVGNSATKGYEYTKGTTNITTIGKDGFIGEGSYNPTEPLTNVLK